MTCGQKTWVTKVYSDETIQLVTWFVNESLKGGDRFLAVVRKLSVLTDDKKAEFGSLLDSGRFGYTVGRLYSAIVASPLSAERLAYVLKSSFTYVEKAKVAQYNKVFNPGYELPEIRKLLLMYPSLFEDHQERVGKFLASERCRARAPVL